MSAAQSLRLPYWDWAKPPPPGEEYLPSLLTNEKVSVQLPTGRTEIDNPLHRYEFGDNPAPPLNWATTPHVCWQRLQRVSLTVR